MATYYVSNENGDWWTVDTDSGVGQTLFIISASELDKVTDTTHLDKLEREIREHGIAQDLELE
jgi:hypothetical protein